MKIALFGLGLLAFASASAMDSSSFDKANAVDTDVQPEWTSTINDLLFDSTFNGNGRKFYDFSDANGNVDKALRVLPATGGGYWLVGYHTSYQTGSARYIAIAKLKADGSFDSSYGDGGSITVATTMDSVVDVAKGLFDTLYFVGTRRSGGANTWDVGIDCIDNAGAHCDGFGTSGAQTYALNLGGDPANFDDRPTRIVWFSGQLYVVGETDVGSGTATDKAAFAINVNPSSGARNLSFGNVTAHPGVFLHNPNYYDPTSGAKGRDVALDVLAYSPSAFAIRLVLVGETQHAAIGGEDTDGFVLSVNGVTGQVDNFINRGIFADLGNKHKDRLVRVTRRHNGGFAVAGEAEDDSADQTQLLLAAFKADGSYDSAFGTRHALVISGYNSPYGLAERADTRDLVVGINIDDSFGDGHRMQGVVQIGRNGDATVLNAFNDLDFPAASTAAKHSSGNDLSLDGSNRVVVAGYRCWQTVVVGTDTVCGDTDMTAGRFVANDTIFADAFGGGSSD